ncbi:hypothetical protein BGZ79_005523 [Entomortierella chlamydospora]|nr:hypothetical protein BGZ79_005523 [Entomortierella chlamydospora]
MPKRRAVTNATATSKANNVNTLKKSASSAKEGSSVDKRLTQPSLSDFFTRVRPGSAMINRPMTTTTPTSMDTSAPATTIFPSNPSELQPQCQPQPTLEPASAPIKTFGAKARKTIIIEDDSDDGVVDRERGAALVHTAKPLKRARCDRHNVDSDGDKQRTAPTTPPREEIDRPFEERMPGIVLAF